MCNIRRKAFKKIEPRIIGKEIDDDYVPYQLPSYYKQRANTKDHLHLLDKGDVSGFLDKISDTSRFLFNMGVNIDSRRPIENPNKNITLLNKNLYDVKYSDLIGALFGFPLDIAQWMVDQQVRQNTFADITLFQRDYIYYGIDRENGFYTSKVKDFNSSEIDAIIKKKNFHLFFEKYTNYKSSRFGWQSEKEIDESDSLLNLPIVMTGVFAMVSDDGTDFMPTMIIARSAKGKFMDTNGNFWSYCKPIIPPPKASITDVRRIKAILYDMEIY